ncbi:peptidase_M14 domain-containing protein [Haematococcus lacustris]|uniref:Peptidase_M14 domain-containing protein n=1 Tax=Haematococcus lacustris TaxID=44745 RepID=A0A699YQZ3_HAELA|nr:peptidase_M14 domain-containing protein [Haematococcus lacustris]
MLRHWAGPDPQLVPEVHATLAAMDRSGVDLLLDVHGDEGLPVGQRFDALSLTLEMPFKDTANAPRSETGWSPQRSAALGAAILGAVLQVMPKLR